MTKPIKATQKGLVGIAEDKTVHNIKRTRDRVRAIFDAYPETRNNRELLQLMYLLKFDDLDVLLGAISKLATLYANKSEEELQQVAIALFKSWWISGGKTNLRNLWNRANEVQNQEPQYAPSPEVRAAWDKQAKRDPFTF